MSKYIIEIKPEYEDSFKGLMLLGAKDSNLFVDTLAVENLEVLNSDYINKYFGGLQDEAYKAGMDKAWEIARRIRLNYEDGGIDGDGLRKMFGTANEYTIIKENTASEAIAKIKAYDNDDPIKVGDEVQAPRGKATVTAVKDDLVHYFYSEGDFGCVESYHVTKTGNHYDIQSILEAMREVTT